MDFASRLKPHVAVALAAVARMILHVVFLQTTPPTEIATNRRIPQNSRKHLVYSSACRPGVHIAEFALAS
jgi:hypothetical protein